MIIRERYLSMERKGQSFYENTNVSLNNILLRWHAEVTVCLLCSFLIADKYIMNIIKLKLEPI